MPNKYVKFYNNLILEEAYMIGILKSLITIKEFLNFFLYSLKITMKEVHMEI